ncbi:MAG: hypothetical protein M3384_07400 [Acidobacteriota bacterium]|nr:hypothetical protein [Acidobacteriota bacterium]
MSIGLVGKLALIGAMAITTLWGDGFVAPIDQVDCDFRCCVNQCIHDSSTGCNGGTRCCENLCR